MGVPSSRARLHDNRDVLIREEPATELVVATRVLARAERLAPDGRATLRTGEVVYVAGRGVSNHTVTPYDVAIVRIVDGDRLAGVPPEDIDRYLALYRADPAIASVIARVDGVLVAGPSLRACALLVLAGGAPAAGSAPWDDTREGAWRALVAEARIAGALIGAFPPGGE